MYRFISYSHSSLLCRTQSRTSFNTAYLLVNKTLELSKKPTIMWKVGNLRLFFWLRIRNWCIIILNACFILNTFVADLPSVIHVSIFFNILYNSCYWSNCPMIINWCFTNICIVLFKFFLFSNKTFSLIKLVCTWYDIIIYLLVQKFCYIWAICFFQDTLGFLENLSRCLQFQFIAFSLKNRPPKIDVFPGLVKHQSIEI